MGLFGFLKKKGETIQLPPEEPEFLKKVDTSAAEIAQGAREQVEPELALWLSNGTAVTGLKELAAALKKMKAADYKEHVNPERNDIAEWVQEILNDGELARKLRQAKSKMLAAKAIEKEIKALKSAGKMPAKQARAAKKASAATTKEKLKRSEEEQLLPDEKAMEAIDENLETPIEMPRIEDFQNTEPLEQLTEKTPSKVEGKGLLGFLFKRKKDAAAEMPADTTSQTELPAPTAEEFEPEPHHAKWEETPAPSELREYRSAPRSKAKPRTKEEHDDYESIQLIKQGEELERTEKELTRQEEELNNRRLDLTRKRYELIKQKGELESKKFEEFIRKHKSRNEKEEALVREELYSHESTAGAPDFSIRNMGNEPRGGLKGMPDFRLAGAYGKERLEDLLEEAKQQIRQNNMDEAQNTLHEVQSVLDTVYMTNNEKKQIEYEILEVEADLKLASLK